VNAFRPRPLAGRAAGGLGADPVRYRRDFPEFGHAVARELLGRLEQAPPTFIVAEEGHPDPERTRDPAYGEFVRLLEDRYEPAYRRGGLRVYRRRDPEGSAE